MTVRIYHNPRCSKSRQTLALIEEKGIAPEVIFYLDNPPAESQISELLDLLDLSASQLVRKKEALFKELNLADADEKKLIAAMSEYPKLIERPIVINGNKAVLGRPPENVNEIL